MSADNYLAIQKIGRRWYVWDESASNMLPLVPLDRATSFRFGFQARRLARKLVRDGYYEYGVTELIGYDSWKTYYTHAVERQQREYWEMIDKFQNRAGKKGVH